MSLNENDKAVVKALWKKISKSSDDIGAEAVGRMLTSYPQTKIYFSHWDDTKVGSKPVIEHGKKVMTGVSQAVCLIDNLTTGLLGLSEKHAFVIKVDPTNFRFLIHCLHVAVAMMFPKDYPPEVHVCFDKFLCAVALALSEKYR